jgi:omega-amidase
LRRGCDRLHHEQAPDAAVTLRVTLVQRPLAWEDPAANLAAFDAALDPLAGATDLVVLPEMFTTGFSMDTAGHCEDESGPGVQWLQHSARRLDAAVVGSVMTRAGGRSVNRAWFALPDGRLFHYDKRHLFRMGREHEHFDPGSSRLVVEFRGWRIAPLVCYDLRFPVWSRRSPDFDYDLLLYVANWPARRSFAWQSLLVARAIENQAYVAGVNRTGTDGLGVAYAGHSAVHDFLGATLAGAAEVATSVTAGLDLAALRGFRAGFPAQLDADRFTIS